MCFIYEEFYLCFVFVICVSKFLILGRVIIHRVKRLIKITNALCVCVCVFMLGPLIKYLMSNASSQLSLKGASFPFFPFPSLLFGFLCTFLSQLIAAHPVLVPRSSLSREFVLWEDSVSPFPVVMIIQNQIPTFRWCQNDSFPLTAHPEEFYPSYITALCSKWQPRAAPAYRRVTESLLLVIRVIIGSTWAWAVYR